MKREFTIWSIITVAMMSLSVALCCRLSHNTISGNTGIVRNDRDKSIVQKIHIEGLSAETSSKENNCRPQQSPIPVHAKIINAVKKSECEQTSILSKNDCNRLPLIKKRQKDKLIIFPFHSFL